MKKLFLFISITTFTVIAASAQNTNTPKVDQRQENQQKRIGKGIENGSLTSQEATRLEQQQTHIQHMEDKAKADGNVTAAERARLQAAENRSSRNIYRKKHNDRAR